VAVSLLDEVCNAIGNLGTSAGGTIKSTKSLFGPKFFQVDFDAGINQGAGPITASEWKTIVGSMTNVLIQGRNRRKIAAGFSIGGVLVMTVTVGSLLT
jgi:hypothetical protein